MTSLAWLFLAPLLWSFSDSVETNLALNEPALQSTVLGTSFIAENAVDGNYDNTWHACTNTAPHDRNTWWVVGLQAAYEVTQVMIWNRNYCTDRLQDLVEVKSRLPVVLPIPEAELCTAFPGTVGAQVTLTCDAPVIGRFFIVRKVPVPGIAEHLTMCEVAVRGNCIKSSIY